MATKGMEDEYPNLKGQRSGGGGGGGARVLVDMSDGKGARPRTEVIRELWVAGHARSSIAKLFKCNPMTVYMATKGIAGGPTGQVSGWGLTTLTITPDDLAKMDEGLDDTDDDPNSDNDTEEHTLGSSGSRSVFGDDEPR
jgi:hypothetical protein